MTKPDSFSNKVPLVPALKAMDARSKGVLVHPKPLYFKIGSECVCGAKDNTRMVECCECGGHTHLACIMKKKKDIDALDGLFTCGYCLSQVMAEGKEVWDEEKMSLKKSKSKIDRFPASTPVKKR